MWQYNDGTTELYHHGIKGMHWGIRRYQNYDGTYTQAGLKRYRQAESNHNEARRQYMESKTYGDRGVVRSAKNNMRASKKALNKAYDSLKNDKLADQGRKYYASGQTITENSERSKMHQVGGVVVGSLISSSLGKMGYTKAAMVTATMASAVNMGEAAYTQYRNKRLRAYYGHSGKKIDKENKSNQRALNGAAKKAATRKSFSRDDYVAAHNRAAAKINDPSNHILSDFNKKWAGKYNTAAYQQAYTEMFNKLIEDELR